MVLWSYSSMDSLSSGTLGAHQIPELAARGYRTVAPDLRGYGDSDAPPDISSYTCFHIVGDLVAVITALTEEEEKVFVFGHDWGALMSWYLCLFRPDKVKALVNLGVPFSFGPKDPLLKPLDVLRAYYGDDFYMYRKKEK